MCTCLLCACWWCVKTRIVPGALDNVHFSHARATVHTLYLIVQSAYYRHLIFTTMELAKGAKWKVARETKRGNTTGQEIKCSIRGIRTASSAFRAVVSRWIFRSFKARGKIGRDFLEFSKV